MLGFVERLQLIAQTFSIHFTAFIPDEKFMVWAQKIPSECRIQERHNEHCKSRVVATRSIP